MKRYSGKGSVSLAWSDQRDYYTCRVSDGARTVHVTVGHPPNSTLAVDSPEAYDEAARAAVAFATDRQSMADDDQEPLEAEAFAVAERGTWIGRTLAAAFPPAAGSCPHRNHPDSCTDARCRRQARIRAGTLDDLQELLEAAWTHGHEAGADHEVGDLQGILRSCWDLLTPAQKRQLWDAQRDLIDQWGGV